MTNGLPEAGILLARGGRLDELSSELRNRSSHVDAQYVLTGLAVLAAIILAMWILSRLLSRKERRRSFDSSLMMFHALCKAHGLSWSEQWLLWRVARRQRLHDPARLFLEPERLAPHRLSPTLRAKKPQLEELRERLFAGLEQPRRHSAHPTRLPEDPRNPAPRDPQQASPSPAFPVAGNPALDLPPWTQQADSGVNQ